MSWKVIVKPKVARDLQNRQRIPENIEDAALALVTELANFGPAVNWPNYGKLHGDKHHDKRHCHLHKGRPTWVACWEVYSKNKLIEVYYVGTHEKALY